jgi:hypothetical protein
MSVVEVKKMKEEWKINDVEVAELKHRFRARISDKHLHFNNSFESCQHFN